MCSQNGTEMQILAYCMQVHLMSKSLSAGCGVLCQCAILSPNFRVRDFSIADAQPYPVSLSWQGALDEEG